ncbi:MAG: alkaline phosphatase family protein [Bacillus subtilis]|nr:alkaline phosphatase family protein [Bacillus subtilis]
MKHYRATTHHPSLPMVDALLQQGYRNVVLVLIDGLGQANLDRLLGKEALLHVNRVATLQSVFPPTTVAATTALLSGKTPIETGWLGWCQYVKEVDKSVVFFTNKDYYDETTVFEYQVANRHVSYANLYEQIRQASPDVATHEVFPAFRTPANDTFQKETEVALELMRQPGRHFTYIYWDQLDSLMHEFGPGSIEVKQQLDCIEQGYRSLIEQIGDDTLVLLTADHGQVEVCPIDLTKYAALWETFTHEPSIESRATTFFIKPGMTSHFESLFNLFFRDYYVLFPMKDVLEMNLFGFGTPHPKLPEFLGDYLAVAIDNYYFKTNHGQFEMQGQHAGLLADEMLVPLIVGKK